MISVEPGFVAEDAFVDLGDAGVGVKANVEVLLEEIIVGPAIAAWFTSPLTSIVQALGHNVAVRGSTLSPAPQTLYRSTNVTILTRWESDRHLSIPRLMFAEDAPQPEHDGSSPSSGDEPR